jgi:putative protease
MTELLSPAGTLKNMRYAFAYGADAVYAGQPRYSLRVRNNDFLNDNLITGIEEAHAQGKRFYLTLNGIPHNNKTKTFLRDLQEIMDLKPDGVIMADPGLIALVREKYPELPVHLSVQMNTVNSLSVKFWQSLGLSRIILSRELGLEEIAEIRNDCPDIELEVFVHGALCIAYSGRCLLSGYFNHRDPNQGACTNACRWEYQTVAAEENLTGEVLPISRQDLEALEAIPLQNQLQQAARHPAADKVYLLQEAQRPGEYFPILEDEHGTYIMNSKDLRAVQHVDALVKMGMDCLKIEGRTKSHYYVARTAQVYRQAIDDAKAHRPFNPKLLWELENLANRGYTEGFYDRHPPNHYQNYQQDVSRSSQQQFVAEVIDNKDDWVTVEVKNKFAVGDSLQWLSPLGNMDFVLTAMENLQGEKMALAPGAGYRVRLPLPAAFHSYALLLRYS